MRIVLIFIFASFILPTSSFAKDDLFTEKDDIFTKEEIETLNKKIDSISEDWGEKKSKKDIWKELKKPLLKPKRSLKLQSYEPNTLGYTNDKNDVEYMDFKLSLKYPILHDGEYLGRNTWHYRLPHPYIAFTGRFGQYITSRKSAPVIGKRFNPKVFFRYWLWNKDSYLDLGVAHESNGQSIDSQQAYQDLRDDFQNNGEDPDFARDYISRGWDYWDMTLKKAISLKDDKARFSAYLNLKYFLEGGGVQGRPEEYNSWEGSSEGKLRKSVDGITVTAKYSDGLAGGWFSGYKLALIATTGYKDTFEYNSLRGEFTKKIFDIPFMLWVSDGYQSDLIDYYQRIKSWGFAIELRNYLDQI